MSYHLRFLALLGLCWSCVLLPLRAADEGPAAQKQVADQASGLFKNKDWPALERLADELRSRKVRFLSGTWKLPEFYEGLSPKRYAHKDRDWEAGLADLQAWKTAYPESITARVALAQANVDYAWHARGSSYAGEVKPEGWELFGDRLAMARTILSEAQKLKAKCPEWYAVMQTVALGQSWPRAEYEKLYHSAVTAEPTYYSFYFAKSYYLEPRWYGKPGEWVRYAEEAKKDNPAEGIAMYARICWSSSGFYSNLFADGGVDWAKMKEGFYALMRQYPNSAWNLNHFAKFAARAGDRPTTVSLLAKIGVNPMVEAWGTLAAFETAAAWSRGETEKTQRAVLRDGGNVESLAFAPDGHSLAAGYRNGVLAVWDLAKLKPTWTPLTGGREVSSLAYSPDGKLLAATLGSMFSETLKGQAVLWDVAKRQVRTTADDWVKPALSSAFSPDGQQLWTTGVGLNGTGEARIFDITAGTVIKRDWQKEAVGKTLATSSRGALAVDHRMKVELFDLATGKFKETLRIKAEGQVQELQFSPDGSLLAAALGREKGGAIALFDAGDWTQPARLLQTEDRTFTIAFSPDGQVLASGGLDAVVRLWNAKSGQLLALLRGHEKEVHAVAFSPDGKTVASGATDGTLRLWDATTRNAPGATAPPPPMSSGSR